jgi:hypothetical protein
VNRLLGLASGAALGGGLAGQLLQGRISPTAPYSPQDSETVKNFIDHTKTWKPDADPREMIHDYSEQGYPASNVTIAGKNLGDIVEMAHRHVPGMSAWDPSYGNHYDAFRTGPLSAYNVRAHEFQNEYGLKNKDTGMTIGDVLGGAQTGQMPGHPEYGTALLKLRSDISGAGIPPRADIGDLHGRILAHEQEIAKQHGFTPNIDQMTPDQQHQVLTELNPHLQQHSPRDYVDNQVFETLMGYDVPRAGSGYGWVGHGVEAVGHGANALHDAGQFAADHSGALMGGGAAGLALSLLNARHQQPEQKTSCLALIVLEQRKEAGLGNVLRGGALAAGMAGAGLAGHHAMTPAAPHFSSLGAGPSVTAPAPKPMSAPSFGLAKPSTGGVAAPGPTVDGMPPTLKGRGQWNYENHNNLFSRDHIYNPDAAEPKSSFSELSSAATKANPGVGLGIGDPSYNVVGDVMKFPSTGAVSAALPHESTHRALNNSPTAVPGFQAASKKLDTNPAEGLKAFETYKATGEGELLPQIVDKNVSMRMRGLLPGESPTWVTNAMKKHMPDIVRTSDGSMDLGATTGAQAHWAKNLAEQSNIPGGGPTPMTRGFSQFNKDMLQMQPEPSNGLDKLVDASRAMTAIKNAPGINPANADLATQFLRRAHGQQ